MATTINTGGCSDIRFPCEPVPDKCPTCGGLECLCRPRFFAGQLLTEENLNHLNQYIIKKNQLHNRYLHGTGVVCGLEVSCDPCDEKRVSIAEGYALSPCGNDIVVCADDSVDICELIQDCRSKEPRDCRPYAKPDRDCRGEEETWLLAICYEETASRGITALRSSSDKKSCPDTQPRGAPPQCEPTQVCEGYRYRLFKMPERSHNASITKSSVNHRKCPEPSPHDCVPLAAITVSGKNCKLIKPCADNIVRAVFSMPAESTLADGDLDVVQKIQAEMKQMKNLLDNQAAEIKKLHASQKGSD